MKINERITAERANNISQIEIAKHCGVSKTTVNKWFLGEAKPTRG
jgi:transcriptional regulator with XRE-family HTH domain